MVPLRSGRVGGREGVTDWGRQSSAAWSIQAQACSALRRDMEGRGGEGSQGKRREFRRMGPLRAGFLAPWCP